MTIGFSDAQVPGDLDESSFMGGLCNKACFGKPKNNGRTGNYKNKHVDLKDLHRISRNKKTVTEIKNTTQEFNNRSMSKP